MGSDMGSCSALGGSFASMKESFDAPAGDFPLSRTPQYPSDSGHAPFFSDLPLNGEDASYRRFSGLNGYPSMATSCTLLIAPSLPAPHLMDSYLHHSNHRASDGFEQPSMLDSYYSRQPTYSMPLRDADRLGPLDAASPDSFLYQSPPLVPPQPQYAGVRPIPPLPPRDFPPSASLSKKTPPPLPPRSSLGGLSSMPTLREAYSATMERPFVPSLLQDPLSASTRTSMTWGVSGAMTSGMTGGVNGITGGVGGAMTSGMAGGMNGMTGGMGGSVNGAANSMASSRGSWAAVAAMAPRANPSATTTATAGTANTAGTAGTAGTMTATAAPFVSGQSAERRDRGRNHGGYRKRA